MPSTLNATVRTVRRSRECRVFFCVPVNDWQIDESTRHRRQHDASAGPAPARILSVTYHVCGGSGRNSHC